ncbi:MAG TPA: 2-oxoglutarate dehydrogenase complex dihydrolipoyllysine-residue succinyltransferase [Chitinophagales bacterium]|nr:2-oxoglutarate dehydrogenase complex dihydrolipoyllysine-residue succinyltransferase [Chitinophagales bacterium]
MWNVNHSWDTNFAFSFLSMEIEIKVPSFGESINEVTLSKWLKKDGDLVQQDEIICEIESEKATNEMPAEKGGKLKIVAAEGSVLKIGDIMCTIDTSAEVPSEESKAPAKEEKEETKKGDAEVEDQKKRMEKIKPPEKEVAVKKENAKETYSRNVPSPAADKLIRETGAEVENGSGKDGRITKADVLSALKNKTALKKDFSREERREKMSSLRKTVSKHLVAAKNTTAMLTTFNEVDMKSIMDIRTKHKDSFKDKFGVNLGFMSFFAKACSYALQEWKSVNAFIDGDEIIYHDYCDISIAVSTPKGLVVPVIKNAESLSFAEIEAKVADLAKRGRDNKLSLEEMSGGTFTITNGGVFGSLMSTPIINVPQSAILGMHKVEDRPVAKEGVIVIRPMMYVALSYDHRIIDGRESVSFLVRVKELLEHPEQLLIGSDPIKEMLSL